MPIIVRYPQSPSLETSIVKDNEYEDGQNVTLEIKVIPSQYISYEQSYMIETSLGEGFYLSLYGDTVNLSLYTWLQYGVHEIYVEICHNREWYEDDETYYLCSDTVMEVRINRPPIALIEDIANSDSPASSHYNEKIFFEGQGIDEDGKIVEYAWFYSNILSSVSYWISVDEQFKRFTFIPPSMIILYT